MQLLRVFMACGMLLLSAMSALAVGPTFDLGSVNGTPGQQVTIPITLTDNGTAVSALSIDIGYDTTLLSVPMNAAGTSPAAATRGASITVTDENGDPIKSIAQSIPSTGVLRLGISGNNTTRIGNGIVANVKFNVLADVSGVVVLTNKPGASDAAGSPVTITGANGSITTPVIPPGIVSFDLPAAGSSLAVNFTITASANTTAYLVTESSATPLAADSGWNATKPTSYTFSAWGVKTLYVWAKDKNGNLSTAAVSKSITLTEPAATVDSFVIPSAGYSSNATYAVPITTLTVSSNAVSYLITESATAPAASDSGWSASKPATFTITGFSAHTLYAWVKNTSGAVSTAKSQTLTLSTKPAPDLTVNALADKSVTNNNTVNVTGTAAMCADAQCAPVAGVTVNGQAVTLNPDGTFSTAVTLTTEGQNTITVIASDNQNPAVTTTNTRTITYDKTAPVLTVSAPVDNSQTNQAAVTVSGTVNETSAVAVSLNGAASQQATITGTAYSLPLTLVEGDNTISLVATDVATNASNATLVKIKLDTTKPSLAITTPAQDITTTLAAYTVAGTASDSNSVASIVFKVNNVAVTPAPTITSGSFQQAVTLSNPTDKAYAISVTVTDVAGNTSTVQRNINFRALGLADALKALRISVGLDTKTAADDALDVAPLGSDNKPKGDGAVDAADAGVILRKVAGFESW